MALSIMSSLGSRVLPTCTWLLSRTTVLGSCRAAGSVAQMYDTELPGRAAGSIPHFDEEAKGKYGEFISERATQGTLVDKFFEDANLPAAEQKKMSLRAVREQFARFQGDVGSSEVQVAILSKKVEQLAGHLTIHKKDHHSRRGLTMMLNKRRKLLEYLRRTNFEIFATTISKLGLKDNYAPRDRFSKYDTLKTMKGRQAEAKLKQKQKKRR